MKKYIYLIMLSMAAIATTQVPASASTLINLPLSGAITIDGITGASPTTPLYALLSFSNLPTLPPPTNNPSQSVFYTISVEVTANFDMPGYANVCATNLIGANCSNAFTHPDTPVQILSPYDDFIITTLANSGTVDHSSIQLSIELPDGAFVVPLPGTLWLLASGIGVLLVLERRTKQEGIAQA